MKGTLQVTQLSQISGPHTLTISLQSAMAAAGTDDEFVLGTLPVNATITAAKWVPAAAVTANGTNFSILSVRNRKADASGTALPATRSYAATNSVAFVPESMTLSGTAADLSCAAGDVLTVQRIHTASGVVIPAGRVEVSYKIR
jgi:hypothetical protein